MPRRYVRGSCWLCVALLGIAACKTRSQTHDQDKPVANQVAHAPPPWHAAPPPAEETMAQPVPLWENGKITCQVDAATASAKGLVVIDLGEAWVPYIFSDGVSESGKPLPNAYRETYLQLARGEFPDNYHGDRAREDKYLELYGIMPTLHLTRQRFHHVDALECARHLDLQPLADFHDVVLHDSNQAAYKVAGDYVYLLGQVERMLKEQRVASAEQLDATRLDDRDKDRLARYSKIAPEYRAVDATQKRLICEGYLTRLNGRYMHGALDSATRDALSEFEHRHRVFSWGYLGKDTLEVLRVTPAEAERRGLVRVLTERATHAAGVLEDGSTSSFSNGAPQTFQGADGQDHPIPDLVSALQNEVVAAFGLQTPESALGWLDALGKLPEGEHHFVAIKGPPLPEYYDGDMALTLDYDRGDVWYEFPYDDRGRELAQPVSRRPSVTVYTQYNHQKIPLARYGTTIGGWRSEQVGDYVMWKYKESPVGPRVWSQIVASPVWLPPDSTPAKDLLKKRKNRQPGEPKYVLNYHETGPSYASAYGLVAAYHHKYLERQDGTIDIGEDEGIRTHGSVDYMSIMRRHSHGCHRLHNHIAVRLMSFVLAHRPHTRVGQEALAYKKTIEYEDESYDLELKQGGYIFELSTPLKVEVLEGRIRGQVPQPIEFPIPKYDETVGAYLTPDGGAVEVHGNALVGVPMPMRPDAGVSALETPPEIPSGIPSSPPARLRPQGTFDPRTPANPKIKPPAFFGKPEG